MEKNQVIITNIEFQINNYANTKKDYDVAVYTQDEQENDMYVVEIFEVNGKDRERVSLFYIDSCGNYSDNENGRLEGIEEFVVNFLFKPQLQTVIQGF